MASRTAPYGTWRSPITAELLVHQAVGLGQVELDGDVVCWMESRPSEGGRQVVVRADADGATTELVPTGFSARTQVHEYGGRCYTVVGGVLVASSWEDQRLWRFEDGRPPVALTPEPSGPRGARYADPVVTPDRRWVICVRERHSPDRHGRPGQAGAAVDGDGVPEGGAGEGQPAGERVDNDLVAVEFDPADPPAEPLLLTGGRDFYSAPAVSPDGRELAWLSWDHPNMPWDETQLWRAPLSDGPGGPSLGPATLAAGNNESVAQPRWSPAGVLHYVSDRSGWWNLYADDEPLFPIEAECNEPGWVFGTATYGFAGDGSVVACWSGPAGAYLGRVVAGSADALDTGYGSYTSLKVSGNRAVCVAGSPTRAPAVVRIDLDSGEVEVLRRSRELNVDPGFLSQPERVRFPTGEGEEAWALVYPPSNADHQAPPGTRSPLVVMSHGGPTSSA
ncbi:MAG: hypothetical protein J2P58_02700, partial [Acidimicrobiaceae bacterium]|nr:hypothetical protein [Acidimicrobiaceae bacterium]